LFAAGGGGATFLSIFQDGKSSVIHENKGRAGRAILLNLGGHGPPYMLLFLAKTENRKLQ
jgi:hypothetical protein